MDKISGSINLNLVYSYKDTDNFIEERQILTSCINKDSGIWYFGDDGVNLKALDKSAGLTYLSIYIYIVLCRAGHPNVNSLIVN